LAQAAKQEPEQLLPHPEQEDLAESSQPSLQPSLQPLLQEVLQSEQEDLAVLSQPLEQPSLQPFLQPSPQPPFDVPTQLLLQVEPQPLCAVPMQLLLHPNGSSSLLQLFNIGAIAINPKNGIVFLMATLKNSLRDISIASFL
jgi:hypothetical protein